MQRKFLVSGSNRKSLYDTGKGRAFRLTSAEAAEFKRFSYAKQGLLPFIKGNKGLRLKHANLELTARCNLRCKHCYGGEEFGKGAKELSTRQWKKIIKEIAGFNPKFLLFTGGECTLRRDFVELLRYAHNLGQNTSVFSNLTALSEEQAVALKETGAIVQFSAYGHNAELHDSITCIQGSFARQQEALRKLTALKVPLRGQAILMKENFSSREQIKKHFRKLGVPIEFSIARPGGRQEASGIPGCASCSFPKGYLEAAGSSASVDRDFFVLKHFYNDCWAQRCVVTAQGKVLACPFARERSFGDLTKESFAGARKRLLRNAACYKIDHINGCKECSLRYACIDCRSWAKALTGRWKGKNEYCKEID